MRKSGLTFCKLALRMVTAVIVDFRGHGLCGANVPKAMIASKLDDTNVRKATHRLTLTNLVSYILSYVLLTRHEV